MAGTGQVQMEIALLEEPVEMVHATQPAEGGNGGVEVQAAALTTVPMVADEKTWQ